MVPMLQRMGRGEDMPERERLTAHSAARDAACCAARIGAHSAARDAAYCAARIGAHSAARAAANAAARAAAWTAWKKVVLAVIEHGEPTQTPSDLTYEALI
jgi:hypothetical protein